MPKRRTLIKAALAAPAMAAPSAPPAPRAPGGDAAARRAGRGGALFALYTDWLAYGREWDATLDALARAEAQALAAGGAAWNAFWDGLSGCRSGAARFTARCDALCEAQRRALCAAAATPGDSLDDVAVKLALWRRAHMDMRSGRLVNGWDALAFSAYDDALALAGRTELAHESDEKLRAAIIRARD